MKLLKVSVPNFRNLQNVELTFEPDLNPPVFPIASQNGGGKSTLLQLIFTLLHCSIDEDRYEYIENLLLTTKIKYSNNRRKFVHNIAKFDFLNKEILIGITFKVVNRKYFHKKEIEDISNTYSIFIAAKIEYKRLQRELRRKQYKKKTQINNDVGNLKAELEIEETNTNIKKYTALISDAKNKIEEFKFKYDYLSFFPLVKLSNKFDVTNNDEFELFFCCTQENGIDYDLALDIFNCIGKHIFLAAPSTQSYLFLDAEIRKEFFENLTLYFENLVETQECNLLNLYFYNSLIISEISEIFINSIKQDNQEAIANSNFSYGSNFKNTIDDFHDFLGHDKYILPTPELNSVVVQKQISETERIELEPEDLSHGELRRLGLYAWIKYNVPENSIILIDEVENALHPDWQYNIAEELASWGNNQYLLATHSFHLCEALTPKHVKEIEPKMCNPSSEEI